MDLPQGNIDVKQRSTLLYNIFMAVILRELEKNIHFNSSLVWLASGNVGNKSLIYESLFLACIHLKSYVD